MNGGRRDSRPPTDITDSPIEVTDEAALCAVITTEIDEIHRTGASAGWTTWALLVAAGACVWLLVNQLEARSHVFDQVIILGIAASFLLIAFRTLSWLLTDHTEDCVQGRFHYSRSVLVREHPAIALALARHSLVLYLLTHSAPAASAWISSAAHAVSWFALSIGALALVISMCNIPIPANNRTTGIAVVFAVLFSALSGTIAWSYLNAATAIGALSNFSSLKVAGLSVVIYILTSLLCHQIRPSPMLGNLIRLRRDLTLHRVPLGTAVEQLQVILWGFRPTDHISSANKTLVDLLQSADVELHLAEKQIAAFVSVAKKQPSDDDSRLVALSAIQEAMTKHFIACSEMMLRRVFPFMRRLVFRASVATAAARLKIAPAQHLTEAKDAIQRRIDQFNSLVATAHREIAAASPSGVESAASIIDRLNQVPGITFDRNTAAVIQRIKK